MTEVSEQMVEAACVGYWPTHWPQHMSEKDAESIRTNMRAALNAALAARPSPTGEKVEAVLEKLDSLPPNESVGAFGASGQWVELGDVASVRSFLAALATANARVERLERAMEAVARYAWRTDPPNANNPFTDDMRFSAIKYHPTVQEFGKPHIELADSESRAALMGVRE